MADRGWVLNLGEQRWDLLGDDGERLYGYLTLDFLLRADEPLLGSVLTRRGWPPLVPGVPWIHCVLAGGPFDGRHEYLDPMAYDAAAPERLLISWGAPVSAPGAPVRLTCQAVYRRQIQVCGHGRACAYPYSWDRGLW